MKITSSHILITFAAMVVFLTAASGQEAPQPSQIKPPLVAEQTDEKPDLLGQLGLSREQIQRIRRMNADRKPLIEAANTRLREANKNLDQAIYGDVSVDSAEFLVRLNEYQSAQADVARIRFESELNVRRILSPDQLVKFRDIRRQFAEKRKEMRQQNAPFRPRRQLRQQLKKDQPLRPNP
ncbi:MAG: hypothetical protein ABI878_07560 [Acidobacteriota bacterium]